MIGEQLTLLQPKGQLSEITNSSNDFEIVDINDASDPFIRLAQWIYEKCEFSEFDKYRNEMHQLADIFIDLSQKIQIHIRQGQSVKINQAIKYFEDYFKKMYERISEYEISDDMKSELPIYFRIIDQYVSKYDINYITRNNDSLVSTFQKEWEVRRFQLDQIYNKKFNENISIKKRNNNRLWGTILKTLGFQNNRNENLMLLNDTELNITNGTEDEKMDEGFFFSSHLSNFLVISKKYCGFVFLTIFGLIFNYSKK